MTEDPAGRCSLCGRLVLGLAGQDWCVLPWMLDGDDGGVRAGPCHVRCLDERGVARRWAEAVEATLARVVAGLGLTDRYPDGAGVVTHRWRNVGTAPHTEMIDMVVARHPLTLDDGCRRAAHELMRRAV